VLINCAHHHAIFSKAMDLLASEFMAHVLLGVGRLNGLSDYQVSVAALLIKRCTQHLF
jgi:hypothetical protein